MLSVVVNGIKAIEVNLEMRTQLDEIIYNTGTTGPQKHEQMCMLFRVNRFIPATSYKPYAIRATNIEVYDNCRRMLVFGGWYQCFFCNKDISTMKPPGSACPQCGKNAVQNFKINEPQKNAGPRLARK